jgi:hypothetical protein
LRIEIDPKGSGRLDSSIAASYKYRIKPSLCMVISSSMKPPQNP